MLLIFMFFILLSDCGYSTSSKSEIYYNRKCFCTD